MTKRDKTTVDDIIGIIHTDETTNSVEEVKKLRGRENKTEKRFTFTQDTLAKADVFDGSEFVCCTLSVWVEQLVDLLNQLNDENEQLKEINRNLKDFRNFITEQNVLNEKQRKELQLQMLRLYNYFENYFEDTMSPNAFSEMWDNVKEDEKWEKR